MIQAEAVERRGREVLGVRAEGHVEEQVVAGVKRVIVLMEHVARKKDGSEDMKILPNCTLPLTGVAVVNRIITDLAVMDVTPEGLRVIELAPGVTREALQAKTGVTLI